MSTSFLPEVANIARARGDTVPMDFNLTDAAGAPLDITGASFLLTVDPSPEPTTSAGNLFQLTGVIQGSPTLGKVRFTMSALQANQTPNEYFYDLQMTDSGGFIRTISKGSFTFEQDVTK